MSGISSNYNNYVNSYYSDSAPILKKRVEQTKFAAITCAVAGGTALVFGKPLIKLAGIAGLLMAGNGFAYIKKTKDKINQLNTKI